MSAKRFVLLLCTYICQKSNASNAVIPFIPAVFFSLMETNQLSPTPLTTVMKTRDFIIMFI